FLSLFLREMFTFVLPFSKSSMWSHVVKKVSKLILFCHGVKYLTILLPARTDVCNVAFYLRNVAVDVAVAVIKKF
ncbi:hypothetical protein VIGAN_01121800, partial [Vigna angularis var. angularis]